MWCNSQAFIQLPMLFTFSLSFSPLINFPLIKNLLNFSKYPKNKKPLQDRRGNFFSLSLGIEFTFRGNWHQHNASGMTLQVAGLHRVRPSTTLDKSSIFFF